MPSPAPLSRTPAITDSTRPPTASPRNTRPLRIALGVYWAVLFAVTHLPQINHDTVPEWELLPFDKTMHFLTFGGLAGWLCWNRFLSHRGRWANAALALGVGVVYAVIEEITQPWFGRACDAGDLLADLVGLAVGSIVSALLWTRIWPHAPRHHRARDAS